LGSTGLSISTVAACGDDYVGGLVGNNFWHAAVTGCYSTGTVSGTGWSWSVGGLVGSNFWGSVTRCFWDIETSRQNWSAGAGGRGKTTAEMQTAGTFLDAGWDLVNIWGVGENQTYPYLRKYSAANINEDGSVNLLDLAALAENWLTGVAP